MPRIQVRAHTGGSHPCGHHVSIERDETRPVNGQAASQSVVLKGPVTSALTVFNAHRWAKSGESDERSGIMALSRAEPASLTSENSSGFDYTRANVRA